ncbi:hypothetical protein Aab01nite_26900 [Paractinoplanes abujensis]|uniref:Uncharacterized protein n=1 Tax=Paractinoplanes abujensis TaxID=882441 RepID=A0A7W7D149_9ACTN|nr:hypothetical protein [Actinoplanes abujensis]MBB4698415.1 hypothetical protein [Actinoplanes abujensis]GID19100.1 hypothetical protein Aab01nite_26900 [Actinoplanes abujensis]
MAKPVDDASADKQLAHKTAKIGFWGAVVVAVIGGAVTLGGALIAKPRTTEKPVPAPSPPAGKRTQLRFDSVDRPVGLCNVFDGTGDWSPADFDLLVFNRPWDDREKVGTGAYYLDGLAEKLADGVWKGPRQEIGRDTRAGFTVEITAVLVRHDWSGYLQGVVAPDHYWVSKTLPPHEAVASLVVTRDGTDGGC